MQTCRETLWKCRLHPATELQEDQTDAIVALGIFALVCQGMESGAGLLVVGHGCDAARWNTPRIRPDAAVGENVRVAGVAGLLPQSGRCAMDTGAEDIGRYCL